MKADRDSDQIPFRDQIREHILSQLVRDQELKAGVDRDNQSSAIISLNLLRASLVDAEALILRIGEQPPQPATPRGRFGAIVVQSLRRMLFWLTPQIKTANIAVLQALEQQVAASQQILDSLQTLAATIDTILDTEQKTRAHLLTVESQLTDLNRPVARPNAAFDERKHSLDTLYVAFEDQFRGPSFEIRNRLRVYLPLLDQHKLGSPASPVLDLGCGRGEWLTLLKDAGLYAEGVDSNWLMATQCQNAGLTVTEADVLEHLKGLPPESRGVVSAFHLLEHLPADHLITVIDESLRVLQPGGLAIFETPNPGNLLVGTHTFYTDLSHYKPLPSATLAFLAKARGFQNVQILPLHPDPESLHLPGSDALTAAWNALLHGPRDYAVVCRKEPAPN